MNYLVLLSGLIVLLGLFFVSSIQPMFMISSLIIIVLMYSYNIYKIMSGYWFSYVLIMVMLSGVLVLFTYMVSLIPNEMFENYNLLYFIMFVIFLIFSFELKYYESTSYMSLNLYFSYFSMFNLFLVSFLLGIMLMVVWLSYMGNGAVRVNY